MSIEKLFGVSCDGCGDIYDPEDGLLLVFVSHGLAVKAAERLGWKRPGADEILCDACRPDAEPPKEAE